MTREHSKTSSALRPQDGAITDPNKIAGLLGELAACAQWLFCRASTGGPSFSAKVVGVDAGNRRFRITLGMAEDSGLHVGGVYEIFARMPHADLAFATSVAQAVPGQTDTWDLPMPSRLQPRRRREHPRGSCLGLVDVVLRRKDLAPHQAVKATLRDISNAGLGMALTQSVDHGIRAGDRLSDCVLLINAKPMAICAIEIVYTRPEAGTGNLLAGGRFVNLDDLAERRIAKLIATLDPVWAEASDASGNQAR